MTSLEEAYKKTQEIKSLNKSEVELSYDVIQLFKEVLSSDANNKKQTLHYIYSELLGNEVKDWFKKTSIRDFGRNPDFADWYTEKLTDIHIGKETYVKATLSTSFNFSQDLHLRVIKKNFSNLPKQDFLEKVLSPLANKNSQGIHVRYADLYDYYMNQYVKKKETFKELEKFSPEIQVKLLDKLIKNKWFDEGSYKELKIHSNQLNVPFKAKILGSIFKYETKIENLQIFEQDLIYAIKDKTLEGESFFKGVSSTREKVDYIFKKLITEEQDYNKALDNCLSSKGNSSFKKEFNLFVENIIKNHFSREKELTSNQFLIIFKKCYDCGQTQHIPNVMDKLKDNQIDLFTNIKINLRDVSKLTIYEDKVLDFSRTEINKYFVSLLHDYLLDDLKKETIPQRKMKI